METTEGYQDADELSAEQRELFELLLQQEAAEIGAALEPIPRRADAGEVPLSFTQQRLWFLAQLEPASSAYNMHAALQITGALDLSALAKSLGEIVRRHEVLRTAIGNVEGRPLVQVVAADALSRALPLPLLDLSGLASGRRLAAAGELIETQGLHPFDLTRAPLLRGLVIALQPDEHLLSLTLHHIVSDGWSVGILVREVGELYASFRGGGLSPLPPLPIQYADFAVWQRQQLSGRLESLLGHWRERLNGAPPVVSLPADRPRPAVRSLRGGRLPLRFPAGLGEAVDALGLADGATPFMTLLALVAAGLNRHGAGEDLVLGSPIANRTRAEIEPLIGFFANTLALRLDLSGNPTWRDLLARVRAVTLDAYEHQDVPFERLVEEMKRERDLRYAPLVQVMVALQNAPVPDFALAGLTLSRWEIEVRTARFDLVVEMEEGNRWTGGVEYAADIFDRTTVARLAGHLVEMARGITVEPGRRVSELPLLSASERQHLLVELASVGAFPAATLHRRFEQQVARSPAAVAVTGEGGALTYAGLDDRASLLAARLRRLGVGPEVRVALWLERTIELPVAILGVLKAGGAYLPIDPSVPQDRLRFMLEDAAAAVLITTEQRRGGLDVAGCSTVLLDRLDRLDRLDAAGAQPLSPPAVDLPQSTAYVMYTSGSTGRPKGVMVSHANVTRYFTALAEGFSFDSRDVWTLFHSCAFDFSALELWGPLLNGSRVVVVPYWVSRSPDDLYDLLVDERVTVLGQTSSAFFQLDALEAGMEHRGELAVRQVILGGEALEPRRLARWFARHGERAAALVNMYGPTETTIAVSTSWLGPGDLDLGTVIGAPLPDVCFHLLDREHQPVPLGVAGEIHIGGAAVSRGYLGRPELTAARFVPDPFAPGPGSRLYASGDLARRRPDGEIEFLGRADAQVKIRGYRIEPGEIEAALTAIAGVRAAVVMAREDAPGDRRLVAYVVREAGQGDEANDADALRQSLRARLPEPMVPSAIVTLAALPLTANGKVDRKALPAPAAGGPEAPRRLPESALEKAIAAIWQEVLQVEAVGLDENFFDRGGHSLLLVQIQARLRTLLGRDVKIVDLFNYPTVGALARFLAHGEGPARRQAAAAPRPQIAAAAATPAIAGDAAAVAIIGMAGRFPGAPTLDRFWELLRDGREAVSFFTDEELAASGIPPELLALPAYVKAGAVVDGADLFDAAFFDLLPSEAELLDPQQRLLLECAAEALERAGYAGTARPVGVFAGASDSTYWLHNLATRPELFAALGPLTAALGNSHDFVATRLSYKLDLSGPSLTVQTACSTSLVAVHVACQSLLVGECELALAGGASIRVPQKSGYLYQPGGITSPDGRCRAFDARGEGTFGGQGVGLVVLKLLPRALADGDHIHAVIRGSAVSNDGRQRAGFTAPGIEGQARTIRGAHLRAGVEPESIGYVETHGTATPLGDLVEMAALTRAFQLGTERRGFCAIGSVKTNIGHLDAAAGIAGLIKTVQTLEHAAIPPSLHFEQPNPQIDFASSPFFVNARLREWPRDGAPRRAGVSSFGLGGTNAHLVVEEAPDSAPSGPSRPWQLLLVSARTAAALERATDELAAHLEAADGPPLADVAYTLQVGRWSFRERRVVVAASREEAAAALRSRDPKRVFSATREPGSRRLVFLLPGVGDQYPGMTRGLYRDEPVFRRELDRCADLLAPHLGMDLREALFAEGEPAAAATLFDRRPFLDRGGRRSLNAHDRLQETWIAQPAVFATGYALAQLWMSWGLEPQALLGYSLGEYTAACLAGVLELPDALALVARRARLIHQLPPGAMLAVPLSEAEARARLGADLALAAINTSEVSVVAGPPTAVAELERRLAAAGAPGRRLPASHAFHSPMMEPIARELLELVRSIPLAAPRIPYLSNVTGTWIEPGQATEPGYWVRHLLSPVRFADSVAELWREPGQLLVEMGSAQGLGSLVLQQLPGERAADSAVLSALRHELDPQPDQRHLVQGLGRLWLAGAEIDWSGYHCGERRRRVPLPTYPFERQRFWVERGSASPLSTGVLAPPVAERPRAGAAGQPAAAAAEAGAARRPGGRERPALQTPWAAPRTATEQQLAALWETLLGIAPLGIHDSFFELGGHSLLGLQLVARLQSRLGAELTLKTLFEAPTIAELAAVVDSALAAGLTAGSGRAAPPLVPVRRDRPLPLSFAQQRLWFLDQLQPGLAVYNVPAILRVAGPLAPRLLALTLGEIVRRHEALRTVFSASEGAPTQRVEAAAPFALRLADLAGLPHERREAVARELVAREIHRPFDLARGPLLRAQLVRLAADLHVLAVTVHHIASDGWSLGILIREVSALYAALAAGQPSPLPELPVQYADFAVWQRAWLEGDLLQEEVAFWRRQLSGLPPRLELPTDRPRPPVESHRGAFRPLWLTAALTARVRDFGQQHGATPFMVLLAAYQALLAQWSGQHDLAIGTPTAGREREELEDLIGFFVGTLVLRADLSGAPSFRQLLGRTRETALTAHAHQAVPFERLVQELAPERSLAQAPLFQAMLALLDPTVERLELGELRFEQAGELTTTAKFDLTLYFGEWSDGLRGILEYATDLFDAATVERLIAHFERLLAGALAAPDRPVLELSLLAAAERHQLLAEWNDTAAARLAAPVPGCLHERIAEQARRSPEAVAVTGGSSSLTYAELMRSAGRLAARLRRLGVGPEQVVALGAERSCALAVALLAVLEAGGAYLPLDLDLPLERLRFMLADAGVRLLLAPRRLLDDLGELPAVRTVDLDDPAAASGRRAGTEAWEPGPPAAGAAPDSLAYVIYTSGSTGQPKATMNTHRGIVNRLLWMQERYRLRGDDHVLQKTPLGFDVSVWELFWPLLTGARLVMARPGGHRDPAYLRAVMAEQEITTLHFVPSMLRVFLDDVAPGTPASGGPGLGLPALRQVMASGEALSAETERRWFAASTAPLHNLYGPTEAAVDVTSWACNPESAGLPVPIGRPVANTRIQLLASSRLPVPVGVPGELHIGGVQLARGYLNRPDLTADRFVPDPCAAAHGEPGARLYRTGDRARWRPDGAIEYLGRLDHQVKIRGFRIELGEIEAAVKLHPQVADAAVLSRPGPGGDARLVAYVVPRQGEELPDLRGFLKSRLPDPMVPAAWVAMPALPLSANGKLDRGALPEPAMSREAAAARYVAPADAVEEMMAEILTATLGLPRVGAEDNFFELGGHSLLAHQAANRIRQDFAVELPLTVFFEGPTVAELARAATAREARPGQSMKIARAFLAVRNLSADELEEALRRRGKAPALVVAST